MCSIEDGCSVTILWQHVGNSCKFSQLYIVVGKPYKCSLMLVSCSSGCSSVLGFQLPNLIGLNNIIEYLGFIISKEEDLKKFNLCISCAISTNH